MPPRHVSSAVLASCAMFVACSGREDRLTAAAWDGGGRDGAAMSSSRDPPAGAAPWPTTTYSAPPPPRCPVAYDTDECHEPEMPCDIVHAIPCCGVCIGGTCCAARGQPCTANLGGCCAGLRCGQGCTCE